MKTNRVVPISGSVVYYKTDGTGRDSYIHNINGGLLSHDRIHQLKQIKTPRQKSLSFSKTQYGRHPFSFSRKTQNKFVHYQSDGSGRDHYVTSNEGGSSRPFSWRDEVQFRFKNSLRVKDGLVEKNPQDNDLFGKSQSQFTMTQSRFNRSTSVVQTARDRQLSSPKKHPLPPLVDLYFRKDFDATKQFRKPQYNKNH